jgi:putative DNA primase/helicase
LPLLEYQLSRKDEAKRLGLGVTALDSEVKRLRQENEPNPGQGSKLSIREPEPWPEPIDPAVLLDAVSSVIRRYVILSDHEADIVALWILHCYVFDAFQCTPRLAITSPEKRCGKTTLLDVIGCLVPKALPASNITAAATFRTIEAVRPTLLIDEADTFLDGKDELRGILNSGHRKGGNVIRTVGEDNEARQFVTHCPVAIGRIGKLSETLADRSVEVQLRRRLPTETITWFRFDRVEHLEMLARKAARWAADSRDRLNSDPELPDWLFNRAADNWRPLFAIAEFAGGDRPIRVKRANADDSVKSQLLGDIREAFLTNCTDRLSSEDLVKYLAGLEDRPWPEWKNGNPMTKNQLSRQLKPFDVSSKTIRIETGTPKGYYLGDFFDAFSRYIPSENATPQQANHINRLDEKKTQQRI